MLNLIIVILLVIGLSTGWAAENEAKAWDECSEHYTCDTCNSDYTNGCSWCVDDSGSRRCTASSLCYGTEDTQCCSTKYDRQECNWQGTCDWCESNYACHVSTVYCKPPPVQAGTITASVLGSVCCLCCLIAVFVVIIKQNSRQRRVNNARPAAGVVHRQYNPAQANVYPGTYQQAAGVPHAPIGNPTPGQMAFGNTTSPPLPYQPQVHYQQQQQQQQPAFAVPAPMQPQQQTSPVVATAFAQAPPSAAVTIANEQKTDDPNAPLLAQI